MKKNTILCCITLVLSWPAFSQELNTIVITPTRSEQPKVVTPVSLSVITPEQIEAAGANSLTEVLRTQAGIQIKDNIGDGSRAFVSMRGFGANSVNNVLIVVDGRKLNNPTLEAPLLSSIALKDIERIEIIQGSGGVLYGDQAVGGVINIITKQPEDKQIYLEAVVGSYDLKSYKLSSSDILGNGFSYRASGEIKSTDNYRENNEADYGNLYLDLHYDSNWGEVFYEHNYVDDKLNLPGFLSNEQIADNRRQADFFAQSFFDNRVKIDRLGLNVNLNNDLIIENDLSIRDTNGKFLYSFASGEQDTRMKIFNTRLLGDWVHKNGRILLTTGYERVKSDFQRTMVDTINDQRSLYAQLSYPLTAKLDVIGGYRKTNNKDDNLFEGASNESEASARELGLNFNTEIGRFFLRKAEGFRFANADDNAVTASDVDFLDPQKSTSYETGYEYSQYPRRLNVLFYDMGIEDEIYYDSTLGFFCCNTNLDQSNRKGFLVEVDQYLTKKFVVGGAFSLNKAEYTSGSFEGNKVPGVPEEIVTFYMDYSITDAIRLYFDAVYTGGRFPDSDDANSSSKLGGYTLTNANINWNKQSWDVGFRINNLGDKQYSALLFSSGGYPSPERNFELSVSYQIH